MSNEELGVDPEILAISKVYTALEGLDQQAQSRVLSYVGEKLNIKSPSRSAEAAPDAHVAPKSVSTPEGQNNRDHSVNDDQSDELGISPAGNKWARRNSLSGDELSRIFSLGVDEIDLVSNSVPGDSKKDRMRSVFLLKGIAAYLSTGSAKFAHDQVREACIHYDAWDSGNFSRMLASIASEVSGSKESGYTLTARGLTNAAEIIRTMLQKN